MVRRMIYHMQHDLPHGFRVGIAAHVFKSDLFCHIGITEIAHPELPALVDGGPLGIDSAESQFSGSTKVARGSASTRDNQKRSAA